jgi:hypothetical protein
MPSKRWPATYGIHSLRPILLIKPLAKVIDHNCHDFNTLVVFPNAINEELIGPAR